MDQWEKDVLTANLPYLVENTTLDMNFYAQLRTRKILSLYEIEELESKPTRGKKAYAFYDLIQTKLHAYAILIEICPLVNHAAVAEILEKGRNDHENTTGNRETIENQEPRTSTTAHSVVDHYNAEQSAPSNVTTVDNQEVNIDQLSAEYIKELNKVRPLSVIFDAPTEEMQLFLQKNNIYNLCHKNKGLALIINIEIFDSKFLKKREGSAKDTEYMRTIWNRLGYTIFKKAEIDRKQGIWVKKDLIEIIERLQMTCENSTEPTSIVVFIGSHGSHNIVYTSDRPTASFNDVSKKTVYTHQIVDLYTDIVQKFHDINCKGLIGKPKVFLISACQDFNGSEVTDNIDSLSGAAVKDGPLLEVEKKDSTSPNIENKDGKPRGLSVSDMFVCTAQAPGFSSFRNEVRGSYFAHCLTFVMMKCAKEKHLYEMLKLTRDLLKKSESDECNTILEYPQVPVMVDIGMKELYFVFE